MSNKKAEQLGMNPSTASHKLMKDILFHLVSHTEYMYCFHCGKPVTRDNFSVEHKVPWLDSDDPVGLYFDLENIAFSHLSCNAGAARQNRVVVCGMQRKYELGCRCDLCKKAKAEHVKKYYTPEKRRAQYERTGT